MSAAVLVVLSAALLVAPGPVQAVRRLHGALPAPDEAPPSADGAAVGGRVTATERRRRAHAVLATATAVLSGAAVGGLPGLVVGTVVGVTAAALLARRPAGRARPDPLAEAGAWDQLAACLGAGLPLDRAVRAVAPLLPAAPATALARVADLAALGADPVAAWAPALDEPGTARLARAARRSARSGAAIADVAVTVASDVRAEAADVVAARAERAGVLVTGPLGLCFLPAFLALGIVPVVVGLAGPLLEQR